MVEYSNVTARERTSSRGIGTHAIRVYGIYIHVLTYTVNISITIRSSDVQKSVIMPWILDIKFDIVHTLSMG